MKINKEFLLYLSSINLFPRAKKSVEYLEQLTEFTIANQINL